MRSQRLFAASLWLHAHQGKLTPKFSPVWLERKIPAMRLCVGCIRVDLSPRSISTRMACGFMGSCATDEAQYTCSMLFPQVVPQSGFGVYLSSCNK